MNLATAQSRFIKGLTVRYGVNFTMAHGEVVSVRVDPQNQLGALVTVRLNSGRVEEYDADDVAFTEGTFRCDFCRKQKPDHDRSKVFGLSNPKSCSACLPRAKLFVMRTTTRARTK